MDTMDSIYQRRSIRHFDHTFEISDKEETEILEATIQSPTCYNIQNWRFVVIRDNALRHHIERNYGANQSQFTEASLLILLTADTKAWQKSPERYYANAPTDIQPHLVGMIAPYFLNRPWLERDEANRSMGIAAQTMMLSAKAKGYDSCAMMGYDHEGVAQLICLPHDHIVGPFIAIGKAKEKAHPKPGQLPLQELVYYNGFSTPKIETCEVA